jgi:pimeloyl-ACP methyl ester carboxylesterase
MSEPLVLIMGKFCDARVFQSQIAEFSQERMVIVPPVFYGERIGDYTASILSMLPEKFAVMGHDLGGYVAMEMLRKAPNRVARFGLMSTNSLSETPQDAALKEGSIISIRAGRLDDVSGEEAIACLANRAERNTSVALIKAMAASIGPERAIAQIRAIQKRPDQQGTLRKCKVPSVVICGDQDPITPVKRHDFMAGMIPNAQLRVLENTGHFPTIEAPSETNAVLRDWLAQPYVLR